MTPDQPAAPAEGAAPTRILNVNDNEGSRYMSSRILRRAGFVVVEARTGAEAFARARAERPALVLLDIRLPDTTGFEVCRRLRSDPETQAIKVLYTSAMAKSFDDQIRSLDGGADAYISQPFEPDQLVETVRELLSR